MTKSVVVTLEVDIPDTETNKAATITIDSVNYAGKIVAIIIHQPTQAGKVTLEGPGLKAITE